MILCIDGASHAGRAMVSSSVEPHYDEADFPADRRPVIRTLNAFAAAEADGRVPAGVATAGGPDYPARQAVFYIPGENEAFRRAVAEVLPAGAYRIEVRGVYGGISAT